MEGIIRGITIDNGGSEVRVLPCDKTVDNGMITMSNDFVTIKDKDFRVKDVEDVYALCRFVEAPKNEYLGIIAQGLTGRAYPNTLLLLNNQENKTSSEVYYRQFLFAVARDAISYYMENADKFVPHEVKTGLFKKRVECVVQKPEFNYVIVTCIPIKEHSGNKDCSAILKQNLCGNYKVEFPLVPGSPTIAFHIEEKHIGVTPEGGVVMVGMRKQVGSDDITLIIDMGQITTDIAVYQGTTLLGKVRSPHYAGSMLVSSVRSALEEEGYRLSDEQAAKALETGKVRNGNTVVDMSKLIRAEKVAFAENYLKKEVIQALSDNMITASQVQHVIPIGGPMQESGAGSVQGTVIEACGLSKADVRLVAKNTRYANIEAASLFTKKMVSAAIKEQEAELASEG